MPASTGNNLKVEKAIKPQNTTTMVPSIVDATQYSVQTLNPIKSPVNNAQVTSNTEEVINGYNLSKLFSVYEPKSW